MLGELLSHCVSAATNLLCDLFWDSLCGTDHSWSVGKRAKTLLCEPQKVWWVSQLLIDTRDTHNPSPIYQTT